MANKRAEVAAGSTNNHQLDADSTNDPQLDPDELMVVVMDGSGQLEPVQVGEWGNGEETVDHMIQVQRSTATKRKRNTEEIIAADDDNAAADDDDADGGGYYQDIGEGDYFSGTLLGGRSNKARVVRRRAKMDN